MTWKLTDWGKTRLPLPFVEWRDLTDAEFRLAEARYPELRERGYFEFEEDEKPKRQAKKDEAGADAPERSDG